MYLDESDLCHGNPNGSGCLTVVSIYSLFGVLANLVLAILTSILLSSLILASVLELPYMESQKIAGLSVAIYAIFEVGSHSLKTWVSNQTKNKHFKSSFFVLVVKYSVSYPSRDCLSLLHASWKHAGYFFYKTENLVSMHGKFLYNFQAG